ncbi:ABC transporter related [Gloeothece citriformis PCC 7424]|uniref:ABC transporter related n=1 Tax=Gloeothece citriformis (strain PCC 7424) TaxID=65393 RepID=B7K6R6_GLOC7|nr:ABC transporter ATP-binding protein [Gloeothece citriformis]ACK72615.1 ABC transporter related [Gloeothece citriformis PCC 7424]
MNDAIVVSGVGKQFVRYHNNKPLTFQEAVLQGFRGMKRSDRFWALQDISFQIGPGRMVGLIGRNGSGKSTLLRLIGGIGRPDRGKIKVRGRIRALLDLGVNLHPDLTGRENIFINGVIAGLTRREVQRQFESIVEFAELAPFIDSPLRTYSTGMRMRLGFAIAVHTWPDVLLVDEVLAVGDLAFQRKCLDRIAQFKAEGCTIVFVSHDETQIKQLCDEVVYLRQGQLVAWGEPEIVVGQYLADNREKTHRVTPKEHSIIKTAMGTELRVHENRFGSLEMEIINVRLLDKQGVPITELLSGDPLSIEIEYLAPAPIPSPFFGVAIEREDGVICYDTTTLASGEILPTLQGRGKIVLHFKRLDLNHGQYYINVGIYQSNGDFAYDYHWQVYPLLINTSYLYDKGVLKVPHVWQFDPAYDREQKQIYK